MANKKIILGDADAQPLPEALAGWAWTSSWGKKIRLQDVDERRDQATRWVRATGAWVLCSRFDPFGADPLKIRREQALDALGAAAQAAGEAFAWVEEGSSRTPGRAPLDGEQAGLGSASELIERLGAHSTWSPRAQARAELALEPAGGSAKSSARKSWETRAKAAPIGLDPETHVDACAWAYLIERAALEDRENRQKKGRADASAWAKALMERGGPGAEPAAKAALDLIAERLEAHAPGAAASKAGLSANQRWLMELGSMAKLFAKAAAAELARQDGRKRPSLSARFDAAMEAYADSKKAATEGRRAERDARAEEQQTLAQASAAIAAAAPKPEEPTSRQRDNELASRSRLAARAARELDAEAIAWLGGAGGLKGARWLIGDGDGTPWENWSVGLHSGGWGEDETPRRALLALDALAACGYDWIGEARLDNANLFEMAAEKARRPGWNNRSGADAPEIGARMGEIAALALEKGLVPAEAARKMWERAKEKVSENASLKDSRSLSAFWGSALASIERRALREAAFGAGSSELAQRLGERRSAAESEPEAPRASARSARL
jgi:hypothetical protein